MSVSCTQYILAASSFEAEQNYTVGLKRSSFTFGISHTHTNPHLPGERGMCDPHIEVVGFTLEVG